MPVPEDRDHHSDLGSSGAARPAVPVVHALGAGHYVRRADATLENEGTGVWILSPAQTLVAGELGPFGEDEANQMVKAREARDRLAHDIGNPTQHVEKIDDLWGLRNAANEDPTPPEPQNDDDPAEDA